MIDTREIDTFDVVVIGGGGSGLAAAIAARELGARVVLLEKHSVLGGSTAWSVGSVTATRTPHQRRKGIEDNPEDHWADIALFNTGDLAERDNPDLRKILCDEAPEAFRWLLSLGVRFFGPMPEPPHRKPRMHNVLPNSQSFIYHLRRQALALGVTIRLNARVTRLIEEQGRITGVEEATPEGSRSLIARKAVILAAGDFSSDPVMKKRFMGDREATVSGLNTLATGDGQVLGLQHGAEVINGDLALGPEIRFVPPSKVTLLRRVPPWPALGWLMQMAIEHLPDPVLRPFIMSFLTTALAPTPALYEHGALLINRQGKRFCDERQKPAYEIAAQPEQIAYILIDSRIAKLFSAWPNFISTAPGVAYAYLADYRRNRGDIFTQADDLETLARKLGMDPTDLTATVDRSKAEIHARPGDSPPPLTEGPFVALGPVRAMFIHSEGGLKIDPDMHVLAADGQPIPGLLACGSNGQGGLLLKGHGHHLIWAFVSGRRAGRLAQSQTVGR